MPKKEDTVEKEVVMDENISCSEDEDEVPEEKDTLDGIPKELIGEEKAGEVTGELRGYCQNYRLGEMNEERQEDIIRLVTQADIIL